MDENITHNEIAGITGIIILVIIFYLAFHIGFSFLGRHIGKSRKIGATAGFWLTFFLGLIGFIIVLCSSTLQVAPLYIQPVADQLLKFKQLLDAGAITEAEYNQKKIELMKF